MKDILLYISIVLFLVLNTVDLLQTRKLLLCWGPRAEANIVVRAFYRWFGFPGVVLFKLVVVALVISETLVLPEPWLIVGLTLLYAFVTYHNWKTLADMDRPPSETSS